MTDKYIGGKQAATILGVHQRTLYQWEEKNMIETIRTPGGKRMYNVDKYLRTNKKEPVIEDQKENEIDEDGEDKLDICYVRVSSLEYKDDLDKQKEIIRKKYPNHKMIEDIGSGMDFNRKGLRKIIKLAIGGRIRELVIAYRDRLTRNGYEMIEDLIKEYSGGKIIVIDKKDSQEPMEEVAKDAFQMIDVFSRRMNELRQYKEKRPVAKVKKTIKMIKK